MNYIVFDLEWNQPDDGKSSSERELLFEIIEIGAVKLNENLETISEFHELIKPTVYKHINWRTKKMLHLKSHELDQGKPFKNVCQQFLEWCGDDYIFCTWGSQDITELQRNMLYFKLPDLASEPIAYYNLQKIFGIYIKDEQQTKNLEAAVDLMQISKDIPFHRAYSDAYYTAKIMQLLGHKYIDGIYSYDLYHIPTSIKNEIHSFSGNENYFVSKGYELKSDIIENRKFMQFNCAQCNSRAIRAKIRWFSTNSKMYYGAAICEKHGAIRGKVRIKKDQNDLVYAEKILTYVPLEEIELLKEKKKSAKKHTVKENAPAGKGDLENNSTEKIAFENEHRPSSNSHTMRNKDAKNDVKPEGMGKAKYKKLNSVNAKKKRNPYAKSGKK